MTLSARPLDHCVLPTADLSVARRRLTALGFTVAPDGLHPFGTANCCVYFADRTFLEPLAVADPVKAGIASMRGNVFTARDAAFRYRVGDEGFSALVFGTGDARADHSTFTRAGISAGRLLSFSRPFIDTSERSDTASFKLAFAADLRSPDAFFFTCERVNAPLVDRSALQKHANGARRIKAVILEAPQPADFVEFLAAIVGGNPVTIPDGFCFAAANGDILLRGSQSRRSAPERGLRLAAIVFGVASLADAAALLDLSGVRYVAADDRLTVAPAKGQGGVFTFEDERRLLPETARRLAV
jgi:hypothetical protein